MTDSPSGTHYVLTRFPIGALIRRLKRLQPRGDWQRFEAISPPAYGVIDGGWSRVRFYGKVLSLIATAAERTLLLPYGLDPARIARLHALVGLLLELGHGPPASTDLHGLEDRSERLLSDYARQEDRRPDPALLRSLITTLIVSRLFQIETLLPESASSYGASALGYSFGRLGVRRDELPESKLAREVLGGVVEQSISPGSGERLREHVLRLEQLLMTEEGRPSGLGWRLAAATERLRDDLDQTAVKLFRAIRALDRPPSRPPEPLASRSFSDQPTGWAPPPVADFADAIPERLGPWQIRGKLGAGGMGQVFHGVHADGRACAIKTMLPATEVTTEQLARFGREVEVSMRLVHPHIVRTWEYGFEESERVCYVVMELLEGGTLSALLGDGRRLGPTTTRDILRRLAMALDYAASQDRRYVHRDIKPANVLFDRHGVIRLGDFGLATGTSEDATRFTATGVAMGTLPFMSPEQLDDSKRVDPRTDLWALGVLAWRCLTGAMPFHGPSRHSTMKRILFDPPDRSTEGFESLDEWSRATLERLLEKEPDDRFASPAELIRHIEIFTPPVLPGSGPGLPRTILAVEGGPVLFVAGGESFRIGRKSEGNDFCLRPLPSELFAEETGWISGQHATIQGSGDHWTWTDHSSGGTTIAGHRLPRDEPTRLGDGDELELAGALDLDARVTPGAVLLSRPVNWTDHAYLMIRSFADLGILLSQLRDWPRMPVDLIAHEGGLAALSRPGTVVDGKAVRPGTLVPLTAGRELRLGHGAAFRVQPWSIEPMKSACRELY